MTDQWPGTPVQKWPGQPVAAAEAAPADQPSGTMDFLKSIPGGLLRGFSAAASAAGQTAEGGGGAAEIPGAEQTADILEKNVTGELPKPAGSAGKFGRAIGETLGNPASYVGPGSIALKLGTGAASALTSEGAGQLTEGYALEAPARFLGGMIGGAGAAKTAGAVSKVANPLAHSSADLNRAILRDEDTAEALFARLQQARQIRPDATVADVGGENVRGLVERVAQTPGAGRTIIIPTLTDKQQQQMGRLFSDLTTLTDARQTALQATQETMANRASAATPLYRQAYEDGDRAIWSPGLERLSASPTVQSAMGGAVNIWRDNAIADGYGAMNPGAVVDRGGQLSFLNGRVPVFPNVQFWDYAKRIIDDQIGAAQQAGQNQKVRTLTVLAQMLRSELDTQVPSYAAAREAWGGPSQYLNAIEEGGTILDRNLSGEQLRATLEDMTEAQREAYRIGALSAIRGRMGNDAASMADMTKYLRSPEMRQKIAALMPAPEAAASWNQRLEYEVGSSKLAGRALGNSATARRLAERADADSLVGDLVMDGLTHGLGTNLLWKAVLAAPKRVRDTVRSRADRALAGTLVTPQSEGRVTEALQAGQQPGPSGTAAAARSALTTGAGSALAPSQEPIADTAATPTAPSQSQSKAEPYRLPGWKGPLADFAGRMLSVPSNLVVGAQSALRPASMGVMSSDYDPRAGLAEDAMEFAVGTAGAGAPMAERGAVGSAGGRLSLGAAKDGIYTEHPILGEGGKDIGYLKLDTSDPAHIKIALVGANKGAGALGPSQIRSLLQSLKETYPEAETVSGFRMSGARKEAGQYGTPVVRLRGDGPKFSGDLTHSRTSEEKSLMDFTDLLLAMGGAIGTGVGAYGVYDWFKDRNAKASQKLAPEQSP